MSHSEHQHDHPRHTHPPARAQTDTRSVLGWPAWLRVMVVLPVVLLLWLAVWWANLAGGAGPW